MMNRNLMNRQMFRDGGAAFPDLSGDGKVTQKDILIGRGVVPMQEGGVPVPTLSREDIQLFLQNYPDYLENNSLFDERGVVRPEVMQEVQRLKEANVTYSDPLRPAPSAPAFVPIPSRPPQVSPEQLQDFLRNNPDYLEQEGSVYGDDGNVNPEVLAPQPVYGMQEGGMAPMAMAPQGMMPAAPPAEMPEMAQAQQAGMDPAILEQMLSQASQGIMALDEAEDYEQVMNSMRETDATIEERRMELADIVGEQDAQQTPESVLTLVQPVMMMAKVDEGIGGLAQGAMTEPVTGDMAGGIMSTVNMGAEEGPAPVNFNQGGVVGMRMGGDPFAAFSAPSFNRIDPYSNILKASQPEDVDTLYTKNLDRLLNVIGDPTAKNKENEDFRKAQILFSIAKSAAAFASPKEKRMSPAENLALSTGIFLEDAKKIISEAQEDKTEKDQQMQQIRLAALQGAQDQFSSGQERASDLALESAKYQSELARKEREREQEISRQNVLRSQETFDKISQEDRAEKTAIRAEQREAERKIIDPKDSSIVVVTGQNGEVEYQSDPMVITQGGLNAIKAQYPNSNVSLKKVPEAPKTVTAIDLFKFNPDTGKIEQETIGNFEIDTFKTLTADGWVSDLDAAKNVSGAREKESTVVKELLFSVLPNEDLRERYKDGKTSEQENLYIEGLIGDYLKPAIYFDGEVQRIASLNGLPNSWDEALSERQNKKLSVPKHWKESIRAPKEDQLDPNLKDPSDVKTSDPEKISIDPKELPDRVTFENLVAEAKDIGAAVGAPGKLRSAFNAGIQGLFLNYFNSPAPNTEQAESIISSLNMLTSNFLIIALPGKDIATDSLRKQIEKTLPIAKDLTSGKQQFKNKIKETIAALDIGLTSIEAKLKLGVSPQSARAGLLGDKAGLSEIRKGYVRMYNELNKKPRTDEEIEKMDQFLLKQAKPRS